MSDHAAAQATRSMEVDAAELLGLYDARVAAAKAAAEAEPLTAAHIEATLEAGRVLQEACEAFRRRWFPRSHRVVAAMDDVMVVSPTARRIRTVWHRA